MPRSSNSKYAKLQTDYRFEDLDRDLIELDELLGESNVKLDDMLELIKPLTSKVPKDCQKIKRRYWLFGIITLALIIFLLVAMKHWDRLNWHLTALTRIAMIKLLPYFDWRYLKHEVCLIPKLTEPNWPKAPLTQSEIFDCDLCESLNDFDYFNVQENEAVLPDVILNFAEVDKPLIIAGGIEHWIKESAREFIDQMLDKEEFSRSIPCNLYTNIHNSRKGDVELITLFKKRQFFESFFMHFQNCDLDAMRVFRNYTYRPPILPDEFSPVTYNWLLWNKNYNSMKFKKIDLIEKHTVIGQMFGSTRLRVVPRKNCQGLCPVLDTVLSAGNVLVLTSLWDVEYLPEGDSENMAAILEIKG